MIPVALQDILPTQRRNRTDMGRSKPVHAHTPHHTEHLRVALDQVGLLHLRYLTARDSRKSEVYPT